MLFDDVNLDASVMYLKHVSRLRSDWLMNTRQIKPRPHSRETAARHYRETFAKEKTYLSRNKEQGTLLEKSREKLRASSY